MKMEFRLRKQEGQPFGGWEKILREKRLLAAPESSSSAVSGYFIRKDALKSDTPSIRHLADPALGLAEKQSSTGSYKPGSPTY